MITSHMEKPPADHRRGPGNCVLRIWINAERVSSLTPISYPICGRMKSALAIVERACGLRITQGL